MLKFAVEWIILGNAERDRQIVFPPKNRQALRGLPILFSASDTPPQPLKLARQLSHKSLLYNYFLIWKSSL